MSHTESETRQAKFSLKQKFSRYKLWLKFNLARVNTLASIFGGHKFKLCSSLIPRSAIRQLTEADPGLMLHINNRLYDTSFGMRPSIFSG